MILVVKPISGPIVRNVNRDGMNVIVLILNSIGVSNRKKYHFFLLYTSEIIRTNKNILLLFV